MTITVTARGAHKPIIRGTATGGMQLVPLAGRLQVDSTDDQAIEALVNNPASATAEALSAAHVGKTPTVAQNDGVHVWDLDFTGANIGNAPDYAWVIDTIGSFTGSSETHRDPVVMQGFNVAADNPRPPSNLLDDTKPGFWEAMEGDYWTQDGYDSTWHHQFEWHIQYTPAGGGSYTRPISISAAWHVDQTEISFQNTITTFEDNAGADLLILRGDAAADADPGTNNAEFFTDIIQHNALNPLLKMVADAAGTCAVQFQHGATATWKFESVAASSLNLNTGAGVNRYQFGTAEMVINMTHPVLKLVGDAAGNAVIQIQHGGTASWKIEATASSALQVNLGTGVNVWSLGRDGSTILGKPSVSSIKSRFAGGSGELYQLASNAAVTTFHIGPNGYSTPELLLGSNAIGFFNTTPIAKRGATADASDLATAITLVNALKADLIAYGLKAA